MPPKAVSSKKRPAPSPTPKKQNELSLAQKLVLIKDSESGRSERDLAKAYNIGRATVTRILQNKEILIQQSTCPAHLEMKRVKRATRNDDVNSALMEFLRRCRDRNFPLTGPKEPKISIKTAQDLEDVLESLERFCYETDSANVPLMFQLRKVFCSERLNVVAIKQKRPSNLPSIYI